MADMIARCVLCGFSTVEARKIRTERESGLGERRRFLDRRGPAPLTSALEGVVAQTLARCGRRGLDDPAGGRWGGRARSGPEALGGAEEDGSPFGVVLVDGEGGQLLQTVGQPRPAPELGTEGDRLP